MRALAFLALAVALGAPSATAAALVEDAPGRAVVAVGAEARIAGEPSARARWGPVDGALGAWRALDGEAALGAAGCRRGLCGLVAVEVAGGAAWIVEDGTGVLLRPAAPVAPEAAAGAGPASLDAARSVPGLSTAALVALAALAAEGLRRRASDGARRAPASS